MADDRTVWRVRAYWVGWVLFAFWGSIGLALAVALLVGAGGGKPTPLVGRIAGAFAALALCSSPGLILYFAVVRPRLIADSRGVLVRNRFHKQHAIPWSAIREFSAVNRPGNQNSGPWSQLYIVRSDGEPVKVDVPFRHERAFRIAAELESLRLSDAEGADRIPADPLAVVDLGVDHVEAP
jgi:hypothetical protein